MFGNRGGFGRKPAGGQPQRVPFEPEGSTRQVKYPVARGTSELPYDDVIRSIKRTRDEAGEDELTNLERWLLEGHLFAAYFFRQGGFDYYFAHRDDAHGWGDAATVLLAMQREDAKAIFDEAVTLYAEFNHFDADQDATNAYLNRVRSLDDRFTAAIPDYELRHRQLMEKFYPFSDRV